MFVWLALYTHYCTFTVTKGQDCTTFRMSLIRSTPVQMTLAVGFLRAYYFKTLIAAQQYSSTDTSHSKRESTRNCAAIIKLGCNMPFLSSSRRLISSWSALIIAQAPSTLANRATPTSDFRAAILYLSFFLGLN